MWPSQVRRDAGSGLIKGRSWVAEIGTLNWKETDDLKVPRSQAPKHPRCLLKAQVQWMVHGPTNTVLSAPQKKQAVPRKRIV